MGLLELATTVSSGTTACLTRPLRQAADEAVQVKIMGAVMVVAVAAARSTEPLEARAILLRHRPHRVLTEQQAKQQVPSGVVAVAAQMPQVLATMAVRERRAVSPEVLSITLVVVRVGETELVLLAEPAAAAPVAGQIKMELLEQQTQVVAVAVRVVELLNQTQAQTEEKAW